MSERLRAVWATASSTPWRRAPGLLLRRPGVLAAVAGACAVMVAAVTAVPLFLSSTGTAAVELQAAERCPRDTGVQLVRSVPAGEVRAPGPDPFAPLADRLATSNRWAGLDVTLAGPGPADPEPAWLLAREDATDHVEVVDGPRGDGVWIPDRAAEAAGLGVGDVARIGGTPVPVAAVYRDQAGADVDPFWCSNADRLLVQSLGGGLVLPPPVLLVDPAVFASVMEDLAVAEVPAVVEAGLRNGLTIEHAEQLVADLACHGARVGRLAWCEDGQPGIPVIGGTRPVLEQATDDEEFVERYFESSLPFVLGRARAIQTAVGSGIWPVAALASLAGAGLMAAAAALWFERRRREVLLLSVRGVSPVGLGTKAVLELLLPLLAGAVAGLALAYGLVSWLGPSSVLEPAALRRAAAAAGIVLGVAAGIVVAVVAVRVRGGGAHPVRRLPLAWIPWELALAALTVVSYRRLGEWGVPVGRGDEVSHVDVLGLLFPVLFLLTVVAVVARAMSVGLRPLRAWSHRWPTAAWLAVRRVARARAAVLGLVAASAVAVGVLVYAMTMDRSLHSTLEAKALTFVGSDLAVGIDEDATIPDALVGRTTLVRVMRGSLDVDGPQLVEVVGIDPRTFAAVAFWDDTFAELSLDAIADRLAQRDGDTVPAVVVGAPIDGTAELIAGDAFAEHLTIEPVVEPEVFPGMEDDNPTVYVDRSLFDDPRLGGDRAEAWIRGDREEALAILREAGIAIDEVRRAATVADTSSFLTVSWTFGFMRSLALAAGLLAIGGLAAHLAARRRDRVLGHAFLRRMGLSRRQHLVALLLELTAGVVVGCWLGLGAALAATWSAHGRLDPVPSMPPAPLLRPASLAVLAAAIGSVVVAALAALVAERRAERDDHVEVLRAGA